MEERQTQLRKGVLELALLALLRIRPHYGGELVDELAQRPGLDAGPGTIYPVLTRLSNGGLLETSWRESPSGPPRKYYALTRGGQSALEARLADWLQLVTTMSDLVPNGRLREPVLDIIHPDPPPKITFSDKGNR